MPSRMGPDVWSGLNGAELRWKENQGLRPEPVRLSPQTPNLAPIRKMHTVRGGSQGSGTG